MKKLIKAGTAILILALIVSGIIISDLSPKYAELKEKIKNTYAQVKETKNINTKLEKENKRISKLIEIANAVIKERNNTILKLNKKSELLNGKINALKSDIEKLEKVNCGEIEKITGEDDLRKALIAACAERIKLYELLDIFEKKIDNQGNQIETYKLKESEYQEIIAKKDKQRANNKKIIMGLKGNVKKLTETLGDAEKALIKKNWAAILKGAGAATIFWIVISALK